MGEGGIIPADEVLLVSSDLQARVRLDAALLPLGLRAEVRRPESSLGQARPSVMILDLDQLGSAGAARWAKEAGSQVRILGFYSHIDRELGEAATRLGIEVFRRGRFWKQLPLELREA